MTTEARFLTSPNYAALVEKTDLALVPLGAVEVYGPHLPMGADGIATEELAKRVAAEVPAIVAPLIPVGMSQSLSTHPGTLWVDRAALYAYVSGVARSMILNGSRRILFLNGHAGNVQTVADVCAALEAEFRTENVRCAQIDWWRFIQPLVEDLVEADVLPHGHASEFGTSVMLAIVPDAVKAERLRVPPAGKDEFPDFIKPRSRYPLGPTGMVGDATPGSIEKGEEVLRRATARVVEFLRSEDFRAV
jgi:creatinine amidohydrolase